MTDCYALEMDDLHRRWLPPEILDDIGFADAAAPPAAIEGLAAHLAGLLGSGGRNRKAAPRRPPLPTAAAPASYHQQLHRAPVCRLERQVVVAYGGAAAAWPFSPYSSPAQWQVATGLVKNGGGGALDQRRRLGSPPAKLRGGGGTGVFLPRAEMYHAKAAAAATTTRPSSRDGKASKDRLLLVEQQHPGHGEEGSPATKEQQCQRTAETTASSETTATMLRQPQNAAAAVALHHKCPELALPQEWTY